MRIPAKHLRKPERPETKWLQDQVFSLAKSAAETTQCNVDTKILAVTYEELPIISAQNLVYQNLKLVGAPKYTAQDRALAKKIGAGFLIDRIHPQGDPKKEPIGGYSADDGDVSWVVPQLYLTANTHGVLSAFHTKLTIIGSGTPIAVKGMIVAAKTNAAAGIDLLTKPEKLAAIRKEWKEKTKGFRYKPLFDFKKSEAFSPYLRYVVNRYKRIPKEAQPGKFVDTRNIKD